MALALFRSAFLVFFIFTGASFAHAASGSIDPVNKYAWGTVAGWINFAPTNGGLTVSDSGITGYAWGANTGWINFSPTQGGVTNTTAGVLGGFAWDEGGGWVSFTGVTIDANGQFHGMATGGTISGASYVINFDCSSCNVRTSWRPGASQTSSTASPGAVSPTVFTAPPPLPQTQTTNPTTPPPTTAPPSPIPLPSSAKSGSTNNTSSAPPAYSSGSSGNSPLVSNSVLKKLSANVTVTGTTTSFSSKVTAVARAAAAPVSIVTLLVALFFLFL